MKAHREAEYNRTQFQIDRVAFFSDAVIAIALTLMILEIKIPELGKDITLQIILNKYGWSMLLHTVALFVGFRTIGALWIRHHQLFEHIINYNEPMIKINLYFLFSVMLLPISIQFLFAANEPIHFQLLFYFLNLSFSSITFSLLVGYIFSRKNNFSSIKSKEKIFKLKLDSYLQCFVFVIATFLISFDVSWFYFSFFIFPAYRIYSMAKIRFAERKTQNQMNKELHDRKND
jgi:uncharacterized membrane protein